MREGPSKLGVVAYIAVRLVLLALLGAATTVAVAWGFAVRGMGRGQYLQSLRAGEGAGISGAVPIENDDAHRAVVLALIARTAGMTRIPKQIAIIDRVRGNLVSVWTQRGSQVRLDYPLAHPSPESRRWPSQGRVASVDYWFGWPCRSLWSANENIISGGQSDWICLWQIRMNGDPFVEPASPHPIALPLGVLPVGFLIDTAVYAGAWWIALFGVKRARGEVRAWRGRCRRCGYSLAGLEAGAVCPECGRKRAP